MKTSLRGFSFIAVGVFVMGAARGAEPPAVRLPAFPGAEGAGMYTTGGRGGEVVHVTNLNPRGLGSLAEAVSKPNRIVVFDVSGVIDLTQTKKGVRQGGKLAIEQPNITIAGQTAPGEGICLIGGSLDISASNVIVRYLRSRRGWITEGDSGDSIEVKPLSLGALEKPGGETQAAFDKRVAKKAERGKIVHDFGELHDIVIDHCSTSWATDENLTVTHADRTTTSWNIAAEGCDYANPKQTPVNHSEGSLWGSDVPDGRATMHHMLYAHNRLRNPRTTGGNDVPAVLNFYNNVVYDWHEYSSHSGSERMLVNWLNNFYKPGPTTPAERRANMFEFSGDAGAQIFAHGNVIEGSAEATAQNALAVSYDKKLQKMSAEVRAAMIAADPFADAPAQLQSAAEARDAVFADVGATLPARDPIDLRIIEQARTGTGRIIPKETDLAPAERRLDYRSLPPESDTDADGLPDYWETQFGLDPKNPADSAQLAPDGYANIEHYFNNTDPTGRAKTIVYAYAAISRSGPQRFGRICFVRTGDVSAPLTIAYQMSVAFGSANPKPPTAETVTFADGSRQAALSVDYLSPGEHTVSLTLAVDAAKTYAVGCPNRALVVGEK